MGAVVIMARQLLEHRRDALEVRIEHRGVGVRIRGDAPHGGVERFHAGKARKPREQRLVRGTRAGVGAPFCNAVLARGELVLKARGKPFEPAGAQALDQHVAAVEEDHHEADRHVEEDEQLNPHAASPPQHACRAL